MQTDGQYTCNECGFDIWHPIRELQTSVLGLYDDRRFPGRCILSLKQHAEHYDEIAPNVWQTFSRDAQRAGKAIRMATKASRLNIALMGNVVPHLHFHIFPRHSDREPLPNRPPWEHPEESGPLDIATKGAMIDAIAAALESPGLSSL